MSRIRTNIITNRMANGAPTVSNGLVISGITTTSEIFVGNNIKLDPISGIVTATSFVGDGSGLTGAGPSLANGANNRVVTSSSATALNGEANLTFNGSTLNLTGRLEADSITGPAGSAGNFSIASGHASTPLIFYVGQFGVSAEEKVRIDDSGRVLIGHTGSLSEGTGFQVVNTTDNTAEFFAYAASTSGARLTLTKSRSGTKGTNTVVQSGDKLGEIHFRGADGTGYIRGATISAEVDGTPGTNDMPGRLTFATTADNANTQTERLRIHSDGRIEPKYSSSAGATGGIMMVGGFYARPSGHAGEGVVQAKTDTNANCFDAAGWYNNSTYRYTPQVKGHYQFHGTGMMYTGMNGSSCEQSIYFVKNGSAGSGSVPQYATGYSTNYGNYDLNHISNVIYMNGTTDYIHFHLSSNQSVQVHSGSSWSGFLLYPAA